MPPGHRRHRGRVSEETQAGPPSYPIWGQSKETLIDHLETVDGAEQRTGLDFFREIPDAEENAMECEKNLSWAQSWLN